MCHVGDTRNINMARVTLIKRSKRIVKNYGKVKTEGYIARDTIFLANGFEAKKQLFGAMTKTSESVPFDGLLGNLLL